MTAEGAELDASLTALESLAGPGANLIFESNRVLDWIDPTVHLAVGESAEGQKPSFARIEHRVDARVVHGERNEVVEGAPPVFRLAALEHVSAELQRWLQGKLRA